MPKGRSYGKKSVRKMKKMKKVKGKKGGGKKARTSPGFGPRKAYQ